MVQYASTINTISLEMVILYRNSWTDDALNHSVKFLNSVGKIETNKYIKKRQNNIEKILSLINVGIVFTIIG